MVISTNSKPTKYRNLDDNKSPGEAGTKRTLTTFGSQIWCTGLWANTNLEGHILPPSVCAPEPVVKLKLVYCWATVCDVGPALNLWFSRLLPLLGFLVRMVVHVDKCSMSRWYCRQCRCPIDPCCCLFLALQ